MATLTRQCNQCDKTFTKKATHCSMKEWNLRKLCSRVCADACKKGKSAYWLVGIKKPALSERMKGNKFALGCKHSEEMNQRNSERNKGNKRALGHKHSEEANQRRSEMMKGNTRGFTKECFGELHPRWIKDRSLIKLQDRRDNPLYKQWREAVKRRDGRCRLENENCDGYLIVHHILGWTAYPFERYNVNNGITLCQAHHPRKRAEEKRLEPILQRLVINTH